MATRCDRRPRHVVGCRCLLLWLVVVAVTTAAGRAKPDPAKRRAYAGPTVEVTAPMAAGVLDAIRSISRRADTWVETSEDGQQIRAWLPAEAARYLLQRGIELSLVTGSAASGDAVRVAQNETCETALPIEVDTSYEGAVTVTSLEAWYAFTPAESGEYAIAFAERSFSMELYVYDACGGNQLGYGETGVVLPLTAGSTYYIRAAGVFGIPGEYVLEVARRVGALGETCTQAVPAALNVLYEGSTLGTMGSAAWYVFTPEADGDFAISLAGSDFDTILTIYDRCGGAVVGFNDDAVEKQSRWSMHMTGGATYLIEIAGWEGQTGRYNLWITSVTPPSHDITSEAIPVEADEPFRGSSDGATSTLASTVCGLNDSRDVWHSYTAPETRFVEIAVVATDFDPTLAVFDEVRGFELACNDDADDCALDSAVCFEAVAGVRYLIRVAGYEGTTGHYRLDLTPVLQDEPETPHSPTPADRAQRLPAETLLVWDGWTPPAPSVASYAGKTAKRAARISVKTLYGRDDRQDEHQIQDEGILEAGDATAVLLDRSALFVDGGGNYVLTSETLSEQIENLCPEEPFQDQPAAGWCSGFLVAPDLVATAGHCTGCEGDLELAAFVFGFVMQDAQTPATTFSTDDVYFADEIVAVQYGEPDWALVRLDRPVVGRVPLRLRRAGFASENQPLLVVGHPRGLPRKYDAGGTVRDNWRPTWFSANVDTYAGSSGSAVFDRDTLTVEGILVRGSTTDFDFAELGSACTRSTVCPDTGCPGWEEATRTTVFAALVPSYDVYLGLDPGLLVQVDGGAAAPQFLATGLEPGRTYYWRVVSRNSSGQAQGPIWSFTTAP